MRTLVLFTAISNALISLTYDALDSGQTVCVDLDDSIHAQLKQIGISSIALRMPGDTSWSQRDTDFARLAMPGGLNFDIPLTNLPLWKVLSLDRLSFWYRGKQADLEYEAVSGLEYGTAVVPFSLNHPLPWRIAKDKPTVAVQVEPIRTRAWRDWLNRPVPFTKIIVWTERDAEFLRPFFAGDVIVIDSGDFPVGNPVGKEERASARRGFNISDGAKVGLVLFDSQTEWEFRTSLPSLLEMYNQLLVLPLRSYDARNLQDFGLTTQGSIRIVDNITAEAVADEVVLFRYDDMLIRQRRVPVRIMDISQRWDSNILTGAK